jgi:hypothetical protein
MLAKVVERFKQGIHKETSPTSPTNPTNPTNPNPSPPIAAPEIDMDKATIEQKVQYLFNQLNMHTQALSEVSNVLDRQQKESPSAEAGV